ncbi:MAG: hypothetical protein NT013_14560 [Planctomycetia bacterium]|nr:hypothetical protein [Planctomycetia bacterium]
MSDPQHEYDPFAPESRKTPELPLRKWSRRNSLEFASVTLIA